MPTTWHREFQNRMRLFETRMPPIENAIPVSIKVRVNTGCFHRSCCPHAYAIIDRELSSLPPAERTFVFEEHESGPEILIYVTAVTAGIMLAKSIIELITAIIKARFEGARQGDRHNAPLDLIIRTVHKNGEFREELAMHIGERDEVDQKEIAASLEKAVLQLVGRDRKQKKKAANKRRQPARLTKRQP